MAQMPEIVRLYYLLSYPIVGRKFDLVVICNMNFASFLNSDLESLLYQLYSQETDECRLLFFGKFSYSIRFYHLWDPKVKNYLSLFKFAWMVYSA